MLRNLLFFGLLLSTQYLYAVDDRFAVTSGALSKKTDTNKAVQYYYGEDVQQDFAMAKKLFEKSVGQYNDKESLYYLGNIFFEGKGTKKDVKQGIAYYLQSAQKGYSIAQYRLAGIYLYGKCCYDASR
jgi:TPR repeat protein